MLHRPEPDYKPVLNREAHHRLHRDGLGALAEGLWDISAVRRFAMWRNQPGSETNLFNLLIVTTRLATAHYLGERRLIIGQDSFAVPGASHSLPELDETCLAYLEHYPRMDLRAAWQQMAPDIRNRLVAEMFLLKTLIGNPAVGSFFSLFDDSGLCEQADYTVLLDNIDSFCTDSLHDSDGQQSLSGLLSEPVAADPDSLSGQLAYIQRHWSNWLPEDILQQLDVARAIYAEETRPRFHGPGPIPTPLFGRDDGSDSPAAFTADTDWMSSAVMLAKSIYVWLDQLSSRYQKSIATLAEIPEEELVRLSGQGFNALWLIGIWERSKASRKIKQLCGNPEAEASAYSLQTYRIAGDLGGEAALGQLEQRCRRHGIRLACDVVPNHTGIDSDWLLHNPDWFIQVDQPPYPAYRFTGPDLCEAEGVSIRIEDGYWDHSDAAVVCEHHDHRSGKRRYIYHGNDGTHMPWNDTAQLNFLLPAVRMAMSDLIVSVAKRFKLIRFDAAMTLARKHYRRLWFPPPGGSAGVPSRSQAWMTDGDFERAFPVEFWREVVDRVNREAPDTLLIAEAFWLMESFFVRNLGMHRVYNSAFMNMLKQEENARYRKILKDILAYNPEILKRYVNFMNNPDEATAVEQFDKGDKYFGVATLLATLPGLPMFGHGQVEGYREKYGMEYRRAYWEEQPDEGFIAHHEKQIFPLLRRRHFFAGVENFSLFDFTTAGDVNENVFAFSNGPAGHKALVVYNNSPHAASGRIHWAVPKAGLDREGEARQMPPLWQELGLEAGVADFCRYRNLQGGEYLCRLEDIREGLELQLGAYEHLVFSDFTPVADEDGAWSEIYQRLRGKKTASLDRLWQEDQYRELWEISAKVLDMERLHVLAGGMSGSPPPAPVKALFADMSTDLDAMATELTSTAGLTAVDASIEVLIKLLEALPDWLRRMADSDIPIKLLAEAWHGHRHTPGLAVPALAWLALHILGHKLGLKNDRECLDLIRRFGLDHAWKKKTETPEQKRAIALAMLLLDTSSSDPATNDDVFAALCEAPRYSSLLGVNRDAGTDWFSREGMAAFAGIFALQAALQLQLGESTPGDTEKVAEKLRQRLARATAVGYRLDKFLFMG